MGMLFKFSREIRKSEPFYLLTAVMRLVPAYFKSFLTKSDWRTPSRVLRSYDKTADNKLSIKFEASLTLEDYVFTNRFTSMADEKDFRLLNDKILWTDIRRLNELAVLEIEKNLQPFIAKSGTIVEFGCGSGRNLLWLKSKYPNINFIGLDISPKRIELANAAAKHFGLDVVFRVANVCDKDLPSLPPDILTCFSVHALEQMPRIYTNAVDNMMKITPQTAFFFEPVAEAYPYNLRGILSRLRVRIKDRLLGLPGYLSKNYSLISIKRTGMGVQPMNETCVI